jgi:RNA polymerase sigma-54 factor
MTVSQRLDLRQSQSLIMTPQLQQAIKLLQMTNLEVQDFIDQEMNSNPLLEAPEAEAPIELPQAAIVSDDGALTATSVATTDDLFAKDSPLDTDFDNLWASDHVGGGHNGGEQDDENGFANTLAAGTSLRAHLLTQIACDFPDPTERMIAAAMIDLLDENGFLPAELELARTQMGAPLELFAQVLARLQRFDPVGIFARDLPECLGLQLRERNRLDPAMAMLLQHLDLVAQGQHKKLQQLCGVDAEDLTEMLQELSRLNPKPAQKFLVDVAVTLIPDVLLRPLAGGGWQVELNPESLPRVLANESYYTRIASSLKNKTDRDYLQERWQHANWLVKALHQRATTILKVATEIVRYQDAFFVHGVAQLKPLTLRQVAGAISMHESTVSRVTAGKYLATPRGLFELKYFFTNALANEDGAQHAATAIRHRIKNLIEAEDRNQILADDQIAALLKQEGIIIARRTVAKYREAMNIPSSAERRRKIR